MQVWSIYLLALFSYRFTCSDGGFSLLSNFKNNHQSAIYRIGILV
jgi:hypothetical protein